MYKLILASLLAGFVVWSAQQVHADFTQVRAQHNNSIERAIDSCR